MKPLRLVVYDATQRSRPPRALGLAWQLGTYLYRGLGRIDAAYGARSFGEALDWLGRYRTERPIAELQFWGHGRWGRILIGRESLDRSALLPGAALEPKLAGLRARFAPDPLVWLRTCETLGARPGQDFARALGDYFGARIAGHTFVIGGYQSGLHLLAPGNTPGRSPSEGLLRGSPEAPEAAL
ncbi:MAG TPA: hypothetical protein VGK73_26530, partial [Polyangiaceae bacterium]